MDDFRISSHRTKKQTVKCKKHLGQHNLCCTSQAPVQSFILLMYHPFALTGVPGSCQRML